MIDETALPSGDGPDDPTPADAVPGDEVVDVGDVEAEEPDGH